MPSTARTIECVTAALPDGGVRRLCLLLALLAFALMPVSMTAYGAMAMPADHAMATMTGEKDCHGRPVQDERMQDTQRNNCAVSCAAVTPQLPCQEKMVMAVLPQWTQHQPAPLHAYPAEIDVPPPKARG